MSTENYPVSAAATTSAAFTCGGTGRISVFVFVSFPSGIHHSSFQQKLAKLHFFRLILVRRRVFSDGDTAGHHRRELLGLQQATREGRTEVCGNDTVPIALLLERVNAL